MKQNDCLTSTALVQRFRQVQSQRLMLLLGCNSLTMWELILADMFVQHTPRRIVNTGTEIRVSTVPSQYLVDTEKTLSIVVRRTT